MEWFDCTDPDQLVIIAAVLSVGIAKGLTVSEINSLGNFLEMIGQNLEAIASQIALNQNVCTGNNTSNSNNNNVKVYD